jgi:hypothetical protein
MADKQEQKTVSVGDVDVTVRRADTGPKPETSRYRFVGRAGTHLGANGFLNAGDEIDLTFAQFSAFSDRFEPVSDMPLARSGESDPEDAQFVSRNVPEQTDDKAPAGDAGLPRPTSHTPQDIAARNPFVDTPQARGESVGIRPTPAVVNAQPPVPAALDQPENLGDLAKESQRAKAGDEKPKNQTVKVR